MRQQTAQRIAVGLDSMTKNSAMTVPAVYTILDGDRRVLSVTVPWGDDPVDLSTAAGERRAIYDALIFWFSCIGEEEVHGIFGDELAYRLWPLTPDGSKSSTSLDPSLDYRAASALEVRILCHEFDARSATTTTRCRAGSRIIWTMPRGAAARPNNGLGPLHRAEKHSRIA